jgi:hypothetical protein
MLIELGRVTTETRGAGCKRYEVISVEPFCVDTAPASNGMMMHPDCGI